MNATEVVPLPMMRDFDVQRIYTNVYGNDRFSYMWDPNVFFVGFAQQAQGTHAGFGDAATDACVADPNCLGINSATGQYQCSNLSSQFPNSPCYNASMAAFNAEQIPAQPATADIFTSFGPAPSTGSLGPSTTVTPTTAVSTAPAATIATSAGLFTVPGATVSSTWPSLLLIGGAAALGVVAITAFKHRQTAGFGKRRRRRKR